ncbi:hypothetical protein A2U01_0112113, partial [Trifolium medium]|nr:hypothetical protein [Trifolium medium]
MIIWLLGAGELREQFCPRVLLP